MRVAEKTIARGFAGAAMLLTLAAAAVAQQPAPKPAPPKPAQHPAPAQQAQPPQAQAAPADQNPQSTTASYGDWVVRCQLTAGPPPQKHCEMDQTALMQGQATPFSRILIPLPPKGEPAKLYIVLQINVSFTVPVKMTI